MNGKITSIDNNTNHTSNWMKPAEEPRSLKPCGHSSEKINCRGDPFLQNE